VHTDRLDQRGLRVAEERVREGLLGHERGVALGRVGAEAVDRQGGAGDGGEVVAEETRLCRACGERLVGGGCDGVDLGMMEASLGEEARGMHRGRNALSPACTLLLHTSTAPSPIQATHLAPPFSRAKKD
jgi:hypothetical protein